MKGKKPGKVSVLLGSSRPLRVLIALELLSLVGLGAILSWLLRSPASARPPLVTGRSGATATPGSATKPTLVAPFSPTPRVTTSPLASPTAAPTAAPTADKLQQQVQAILETLPPDATASFINLSGPERAQVRGATPVVAASIIKLAIMIEVEKEVAADKLNWSQTFTVQPQEIVSGTGILQNQPGRTLTLRELLETVIKFSDNTGANILLDTVGMATVNTTMQELGFTQIHFERKFEDQQARAAGHENRVSAVNLARMLQRIAQGQLISRAASADMLRILRLRAQTEPGYLAPGLEPTPLFAHISGSLPDIGVFNDAALFYRNGAPAYILVICTRNNTNEQAALRLMSGISRQVYTAVLGSSG